MRLSEADYTQYYASLGIRPGDLRSEEPLALCELPSEARLSSRERQAVEHLLQTWNGLDRLAKVDAARALQRRVVNDGSPGRAEIWAAYLMLGRLQNGAEGQANLVARNEVRGHVRRGRRSAR